MNREQRCTGDEEGERLLWASRDGEVTGAKIDLCCTVPITHQSDQHDGSRASKLLASLSSEIIYKVFRLSLGILIENRLLI